MSKYNHLCYCLKCGESYKPKQKTQKYCSYECRKMKAREESKKYSNCSLNHLSTSKIGGISEIEVCAYYLREGYEVFRNITASGPADIIVWNPNTQDIHIIDVKTYVYNGGPENFIESLERKCNNNVKIVPYNYNTRQTLRMLSDHPE